MGDCRFPRNIKVREKYPLPLCDMPSCTEEQEYLDNAYVDIKKILEEEIMKEIISQIIKPENSMETNIVSDAVFIVGVDFGKPRRGHIEGKVIYHIKEVLANIEKYYADDKDRSDLRLIAILHDTFKHKVDRNLPKSGANHHGMIARRFAEKHGISYSVCKIIELHDDAYNAWSKGNRDGDWIKANIRANRLIKALLLDGTLDLYVKFYQCDNETGDKTQECYEWFTKLL